ncbi:MAG TPA: uroporphyrinogen-III synthase [Steroidobacteraceae bacterium]
MTPALAGLTVIVTRPAHQAAALAAELRRQGARVVEFPALEIEPVVIDAATRALLTADDFDWVIYASANAVHHALLALPRPRSARIATIGAATARALADAGIRVDTQPRTRADSEGLLALPELAEPRGLRILILRGAGGRELLRRELERRGATVRVGELYRRVAAAPTSAALDGLARALADSEPPILTASSADVLAACVRIVPEALQAALRDAPLLVPGARVAATARELAWRGPLIEADGALDAAMIAALIAHARDGRPAGGA